MGTLKVKVIAAAALATTVVVTGGVMVGRFAAAGPSRTTIRAGSPDAALIHSRVDLSWTTKLPDGTRIRLANVGSFDDRSRKTSVFGPDGSSSTASLNPGEQSVQTDSILLDQNNIGDARVHTFFAPVHTSVFLTLVANPNNGVEAVMDHVAPIGSRPGTADITLNLSKGPYTKLVEGTFSSGATRTLPSGEVVSITRAMKHLGNFRSGGKVIDVTTLRVTAPSRMVESECGFMLDAIDMDGAVAHLAHGGGYSASTPDPHTHLAQLVYSFRTQELTDAHVRRFRFSYRPIDTVVFRNVAIAPKQTR